MDNFSDIGRNIIFYEETPSQYWSYFFVKKLFDYASFFFKGGVFFEAAAIIQMKALRI